MSSSAHVDNNKKDILILGIGPTQGLEHILTAEKMYAVNFTVTNITFCLSLHYNGANSYLFVNSMEIYKFKAKDSECDRSCDFGEYLACENCKCRKRLVDKLIEECNENIEETSLVKINSTKCKSSSCILYIVFFSIFFTINIEIVTYFVYYK